MQVQILISRLEGIQWKIRNQASTRVTKTRIAKACIENRVMTIGIPKQEMSHQVIY